jgi:ligand-binding sensor domain-containing protein
MLAFLALTATLQCVVADEPAVAEVTLPGGTVATARPGALTVGERTFTPCDGLPAAQPTALAVRNGRLMAGFRTGGVFELEGGRWVHLDSPSAPVRALTADGEALFIGTASGLWRFADGKAKRSDHPVLRKREITALKLARNGDLHVGAGPYGWWRVTAAGARLQRAVYAGCFVETKRGVEPRPPGPACASPRRSNGGPPSSHVTALEHFDGHLYVGSFDRGLFRRDGDGWVLVEGVPRFVNALASDGARLYAGTTKGLYRIDARGVERVELGVAGEHVNGLYAARGWLRAATGQGVVELAPDGAVRVLDERAGLPSRISYAVTETADGALWIATAGGVVRLAGGGARVYTQTSGALPHDWVTSLLPDGSSVLAGTYDAGVARLDPDGHGVRVAGLERLWVNPNGLFRDGDRLLVLTLGDGLVVAGPGARPQVVHLPADDVTSVAADGGALWVGTRAGLVKANLRIL